MHPMHGARSQRTAAGPTATQEVPIEVVDVDCGELVDGQVAQVRLEVMLDDAARLTQGGGRPRRRRMRQPAVEKIGDGAGAQAGVAGLLDELGEAGRRVATCAVHSLGRPSLAAALWVDAEIDAQLPAVDAPLSK